MKIDKNVQVRHLQHSAAYSTPAMTKLFDAQTVSHFSTVKAPSIGIGPY